jgi:uncharacterized protein (AIM24 family)
MPRPPGSERHSTAPSAMPSGAAASVAPDSTRDVAQEDLLFHLYRGSELLQENRVLEAKEELEFALTMQPLEPKGQDLLGTVYFRLGLYPRAIQIYENLVAQFPRDISIKINLALAYLKTGQPEPARQVLKDAVGINPEHKRAWGYLGLALQKLGEFEQAQVAFERGGHAMMAKRVTEKRRSLFPPPSSKPPGVDRRVREAAEMAFSELDAGELRFALAEPEPPRPPDGQWHTLEPGEAARSSQRAPSAVAAQGNVGTKPELMTISAPSQRVADPEVPPHASVSPLFGRPSDRTVALLGTDLVLVQTSDDPPRAFACRLDALRVVAGTATTRVLHRRLRDADTNEVLGGVGSPVVRVSGNTQLVLGTRQGRELVLLALDEDLAFVREDLLLGFELCLGYENGRVAFEPGADGGRSVAEGSPIVQLRGSGALVLELGGKIASLLSVAGRPLLVRREWVVGWLGRLVARALPPSESPSGQRGLVAFSGEGTVLVCAG